MKYCKRYIWLLYSRLLFSKITITLEEQCLKGKISYNFPFTQFPKDIKIFIPREYRKENEYMKIIIPFEKMSGYSRFSTAYIRERKREKYNKLKEIIGEKRFSFIILEQWVFYDFLDFLFDHTGLMRNDNNQIERFKDSEEYSFWNFLINFRNDFWFLGFFLTNLPDLKYFLESIPNKSYLSEMILKIKNINLGIFEKKNQLWLVLFNQNYIFFIKYCTNLEIKQIFREMSETPEWFNQIKLILLKKGYNFMKEDTDFGNSLFLEKDNFSKNICFSFKKD